MAELTSEPGAFLDGILRMVRDLEGSILGEVLVPFLDPNDDSTSQGLDIRTTIGQADL